MPTIRGTLRDHRATRESWGVATVLVREAEGELPFGVAPGAEITAVGDRIGLAAPGESVSLTGEWQRNPRFGMQLHVTEQHSEGLQDAVEAARWLCRLDGVGPVLAQALHKHYGDKLIEALSGDTDLTAVPGVGESTASHIRDSFRELEISGDLESIRYLDGLKCTRWEATQILAFCAKKRVKPLELFGGKPYSLMEAKGLGFVRVDRIARRAGVPLNAPGRIEAAATHQLGEIVDRGSTMVRLRSGKGGGLIGETADLLGCDRGHVERAVKRLAANGDVVIVQDGTGCHWVHPAWLLRAELAIYRAAAEGRNRNSIQGRGVGQASPGCGSTPGEKSMCPVGGPPAAVDTVSAVAGGRARPAVEGSTGVINRLLALVGDDSRVEDWE